MVCTKLHMVAYYNETRIVSMDKLHAIRRIRYIAYYHLYMYVCSLS